MKLIGQKVLIIEDEKNLGLTLSEYLAERGVDCLWCRDYQQADASFLSFSPQIVLMDIGLPDGSGLDLARKWRGQKKDFILFFLSALNDPDTRVEGLEIGAQDYITKPFALKELTLRLERVVDLLKAKAQLPAEIDIGPLSFWPRKFEVRDAHGEVSALSQKECQILELLFSHRGQAVDRMEIIEQVWGEDKFPTNRTVDNYIVTIRKWCDTAPDFIEIQSIRGVGYKLVIKQ